MPRPRKPKLYTNVAPKKKLPATPTQKHPDHPRPADKLKAQTWAQSLFQTPFYVIDTETTGIGKQDEIVQIGIVNQDGETVMNQLIKPTQPIPSGSKRRAWYL